jgi:hypothetical protein
MDEGWVPVLSGRWNRPRKNPLHLTKRRLALPCVNHTRIFRRPFLPLRVRVAPSVCTIVTADGSSLGISVTCAPHGRTRPHTQKNSTSCRNCPHNPEKKRSRRTRFTHAKESRSLSNSFAHLNKFEVSKIPTPFCN